MIKIAFLLPGLPQPIGGFKFIYSLAKEFNEYFPEHEISVYHQNIKDLNFLNRLKYFVNRFRNKQKSYAEKNFNIRVRYVYGSSEKLFHLYDKVIISSWQLMNANKTQIICHSPKIKHIIMDYPGFTGTEEEILPTWKYNIEYFVISSHLKTGFRNYTNKESVLLGCKLPWVSNIDFELENNQFRDGFLLNFSSGYYKNPERIKKIANFLSSKNLKVTIYSREKAPIGLNNKVNFLKGISEAQLAKLFLSHKYFISLSRFEGFGLPALEAMYYGCIVITTDNMGNRDYIEDGINCYVLANEKEDFKFLKTLFPTDEKIVNNTLKKKGRETALQFLKIEKQLCQKLLS